MTCSNGKATECASAEEATVDGSVAGAASTSKVLCRATLRELGYDGYLVSQDAPVRVLQYGDGNFLRAFVDLFFDQANENGSFDGRIAMVQPRARGFERADAMNAQDCLYTVYVRGNDGGRRVDERRIVSSVACCLNPNREQDRERINAIATSDELQYVVSNTTEAGIVYDPSCKADDLVPASFPAKLTQTLHLRWKAGKPGLVVLSCELIDHNGDELLRCVLRHAEQWGLEDQFSEWLRTECNFCTTLVDSIVTGAVRDPAEVEHMDRERGYHDGFADVREVFQMWGIQGSDELAKELPFVKAQIPGVFVTSDITPYKRRKVRILNGAHTGFVPGAWLAGFQIVRDCMHDEVVRGFMEQMLEREVIPTMVGEMDEGQLSRFACDVTCRFDNPFIDHQLLSICLNSTSKWRARDLPTLLDYVGLRHEVPPCLATSLAMLIAFYTTGVEGLENDGLHLRRIDGTPYVASDDAAALSFFAAHASDDAESLAMATLSNEDLWGRDLAKVPGLVSVVAKALNTVRSQGAKAAFSACLQG